MGTLNNAHTINPLLKALEDDSAIVRRNAARSLENECKSVHAIVFGRGRTLKDSKQKHTVRNPDVSNLKIPMVNLRQIIIDATTCDIQQVEAFASYGTTYLEPTYLESLVTVSISGDPTIFSERMYELCHLCKEVDVDVETIIFGTTPSKKSPSPHTVYNPDMSTFTLPMPHVKQVSIHTDTYDFHQLERFLTYAVNYMGQKPLKKQVGVHIYGDPEKLHPNLHNSLTNLCNCVYLHRENNS